MYGFELNIKMFIWKINTFKSKSFSISLFIHNKVDFIIVLILSNQQDLLKLTYIL